MYCVCLSYIIATCTHCPVYSLIYGCLVDIIEQPRTMVAIEGTNATFTCKVELARNGDHKDLILNDITSTNSLSQERINEFVARGITWTCMQTGLIVGYQVTILASTQNNGTSLHCDGGACFSNKAMLHVVQGEYYK